MTDQHPFETRQPSQDYFRTIMHTVMGQALLAAGYELLSEPMKWLGGRFRYRKRLDTGSLAHIEFQVLIYNDTAWTGKQSSRFAVNLIRVNPIENTSSYSQRPSERSLSRLVVEDFGVAILPDADYWWPFNDTESLGKALAEAGHLIIGYGIPWLAGDLHPPDTFG